MLSNIVDKTRTQTKRMIRFRFAFNYYSKTNYSTRRLLNMNCII